MSDSETTFSVEVLGFPSGADPEALAGSVSAFFNISLEEGRRLVKKAPIRVKRGASAEVTQKLVRQLRKLHADVMVRNEQTGEERVYKPKEGPSRDSALPEPPPEQAPPPPAETLDPAVEAAPETPPVVEISHKEDSSGPRSPRREPLSSKRASGVPSDRESGERASPTSGPFTPHPATPILSLPPPSSPLGASVPPPSQSPSQPKLDFCGSCKAPFEKGDTCARCGWNNAEKERHCRQCKKKLSIVSAVNRKQASLAAIAAGALAVSGAVTVLFGPVAGLSALSLCGALAFVADAFTLRFACKTCTVAVYAARLLKEETQRIRGARTRSLSVSAVGVVLSAGLFFGSTAAPRTLSDSSYGVAWDLEVPGSHSKIGSEVVQVALPTGGRRMRVQYAEKPYFGGTSYFLAHTQYTYPSGSAEVDKAGIAAATKQLVEVYFSGHVNGSLEAAGDSLEVAFSGTFHGKPVSGKLRATQFEHDMVFVIATAGSASDLQDVGSFLSSVKVQHEGK